MMGRGGGKIGVQWEGGRLQDPLELRLSKAFFILKYFPRNNIFDPLDFVQSALQAMRSTV